MDQGRHFIGHPRILLFEPDRQRVDEFRDLYVQSGYETEIALSYETALAILDERHMHVLVIDAETTGESLADLVKEFNELDPEMSICVVNGEKDRTRQRNIKRLGAQSYLSAPTDPDKSLKAVQNVLSKK